MSARSPHYDAESARALRSRPIPARGAALSAFLVALVGLVLVGAMPRVPSPRTGPGGHINGPVNPYSLVPLFTLPTASGAVTFGGASDHSTVFLSNNPLGSTAPALWAGDVSKLIAHSPVDVR
jgi:hypothetical protein